MQDENRIDFTSKQLLRTSSWKKIQNIKNLTKSMIKSNSQILTITSAPRNEFPIASLRDISDKQSIHLEKKIVNKSDSNNKYDNEINSKIKENSLSKNNEKIENKELNYINKRKIDNLGQLYLKKCEDFENLTIELNKKQRHIDELNLKIMKLTKQLNYKRNENGYKQKLFLAKAESFLNDSNQENKINKSKQNKDDSIYDIFNIQKNILISDDKFQNNYQIQSKNDNIEIYEEYDNKLKEILINKELKIKEILKENNILISRIKDYETSYISKNDHDVLLNKTKYDLTLKLEESKETISKLVNKYMIDKKIKPSKRNIMNMNRDKANHNCLIEESLSNEAILSEKMNGVLKKKLKSQELIVKLEHSLSLQIKKLEIDNDDEQIILDENKINDISNFDISVNIQKY